MINEQLSALARLNQEQSSGYINFDLVDIMNEESWLNCYPQMLL